MRFCLSSSFDSMHLNIYFAWFGHLNHRNCLGSSSSVGTEVSVVWQGELWSQKWGHAVSVFGLLRRSKIWLNDLNHELHKFW